MVDWEKVKKINTTLIDWVDKYIDDKEGLSESSIRSKRNLKGRIVEYLNYIKQENLPLNKVDKDFAKGFVAFLKTCTYNEGKKTLSATTQRIFINRFGTIMENAIREGIVSVNPFCLLDKKEKPQKQNAEKEFLTIDELKKVIATPCRYPIVKKAFLFSCFTGLRWSDVITLEPKHIHDAVDGKTQYIEKKQVKTKQDVVVPLCTDALKWMPKPEADKTIFHELQITSTTVEVILKEWMESAGIKKHITYHCSRHTAATMWLTLGANLYVVSKLLGHRSIKVTEVYARIVDQTKIQTMNLVNDMFNATGSNENGASSANNIASINNENDEHIGTIGLSSISNSQVVNL
jgi:integrase